MSSHSGGCLCGAVQFRIDGDLAPIQLCYCSQCRKAQGGAFAAVIPVQASAFHLLRGAEAIATHESSPGKERAFCGRCGSPVYSRRHAMPQVLRVRAGLFDGDLPVRPAWHAYTGSMCNWWTVDDGLPRYEEAYVPPEAK